MSLLRCEDLSKTFKLSGGRQLRAVNGVSLAVEPGETLAIVGESGCGKSTVGRLLMGLETPTGGHLEVGGTPVRPGHRDDLKRLRKSVQMVFQDPNASLNPRQTVGRSIAEPLENFTTLSAAERDRKVSELLQKVGLAPDAAQRLPSEFSGGQRQRVGIARALSISPSLVIADEAVSALDVSVQAQVLNLMADLQKDLGLAYLFISHDLGVVAHIAHRIAVMYLGRIVEVGTAAEVFGAPRHPYTAALLDAAPVEHPSQRRSRQPLSGDLPSPMNPPQGCAFHTRCPRAAEQCRIASPLLRPVGGPHEVACHFPTETPQEIHAHA